MDINITQFVISECEKFNRSFCIVGEPHGLKALALFIKRFETTHKKSLISLKFRVLNKLLLCRRIFLKPTKKISSSLWP